MCSKKDYIAAAKLIKSEIETDKLKANAAKIFVMFFEKNNPRFKEKLFLKACGLKPDFTPIE